MNTTMTISQLQEALRYEMETQQKTFDGFRGRFDRNPREALSMCSLLFYAVAVLETYGNALRWLKTMGVTCTAALYEERVKATEEFALHPLSTSATAPELLMQAGMKQAYQDLAQQLRRVSL